MRNIKYLVVHCSATKPSLNVDRDVINRWHVQRGWKMIGYHYVITRDGVVQSGRELSMSGAHVEGHNSDSIGICLAGGLNEKTGEPENNFIEDQMYALKELLSALKFRFPHAEILGHRDFPGVKKDCPCFDVREWAKGVGLQ